MPKYDIIKVLCGQADFFKVRGSHQQSLEEAVDTRRPVKENATPSISNHKDVARNGFAIILIIWRGLKAALYNLLKFKTSYYITI